MNHYASPAELEPLVGALLGVSEWLTIDQTRIDQFAAVTGDAQWIHVDPRKAAFGPFGGTVAHGFLTLSLIPALLQTSHAVGGVRMAVNYGLNRVRFPAPVPAGSQVRGHFKLLALERIDGGAQLIVEASIEREGAAKPACVAETVTRLYT